MSKDKKEEFFEDINIKWKDSNQEDFIKKAVASKYFEGRIDSTLDGFYYLDGSDDGGIDYIIELEDKFIIGQSKCAFLSIKEICKEIDSLIEKYDKILKKNFAEKLDVRKEVKELVYGTTGKELEIQLLFLDEENSKTIEEIRKHVEEKISSRDERYKKFDLFYGSDLKSSLTLYFNKPTISKPKVSIKLQNVGNYLIYPNLNNSFQGYLINISAYDLYKEYKNHKNDLFSLNVRFLLSKEKKNDIINKELLDTLEKKSSLFWFANNGIIILGKEIKFDQNYIEIADISIINGAQTVSNIFNFIESSKDNEEIELRKLKLINTFLTCKIMIINDSDEDIQQLNIEDFIVRTSNKQKSVDSWSFYSNRAEVIELHDKLHKLGYILQYKAGNSDELSEINKLEKNQKFKGISLPDYAQLRYAIINFEPGFAIQNKTKLFTDDKEILKFKNIDSEIYHYFSVLKLMNKINKEDYKNKIWLCTLLSILLVDEKIITILEKNVENIKENIDKYTVNFQLKIEGIFKLKKELDDESTEELLNDENFKDLLKEFKKDTEDYRSVDFYSDNKFFDFVTKNISLIKKIRDGIH